MLSYILRRLLLILPTLFGIMVIAFVIIQMVPGGPVEQMVSRLQANEAAGGGVGGGSTYYRGSQGIDPALIQKLKELYGLDKPAPERFWTMLKNYSTFNFGDSFYKGRSVVSLVVERLPVSISLGLWVMLLSYMVSIPLGVRKAVKDGSPFDVWTSSIVIVGYALPAFIVGILLIILFASSSFWQFFPQRGLWSTNWDELSFFDKVKDYFWHLTLPLIAMSLGAFASTTLLTKNSFLDEIRKQYVLTARMKGLTESRVLYGHVFRNAMLIVVAGFPAAFVSAFFASSLLIEQVFSIEGLGLLGFEAVKDRDYPIVLATLFIFSVIGLVVNILSDIMYVLVDPRIDFESRET